MKIADLVETLRDSWMFFYQAGECRAWETYKSHLLAVVQMDDVARLMDEGGEQESVIARDLTRSVTSWFETWRNRQSGGVTEYLARDEVTEYWLWIRFMAELDQAIAEVDEEQSTR